ncbi:hypothetical protein ASE69_05800 [Sphingomonas sp. Leaf208]|nr:hypothetical protein ASE69_05800 [Sphingomonas sp. Leaf208]
MRGAMQGTGQISGHHGGRFGYTQESLVLAIAIHVVDGFSYAERWTSDQVRGDGVGREPQLSAESTTPAKAGAQLGDAANCGCASLLQPLQLGPFLRRGGGSG